MSQTIEALSKSLFEKTKTTLALAQSADAARPLWIHLRVVLLAILGWTYPEHRKTHRATVEFHKLLVAASATCGLAFAASHSTAEDVLKLSRGFSRPLQKHILHQAYEPAALHTYLNILQVKLETQAWATLEGFGFQYALTMPGAT